MKRQGIVEPVHGDDQQNKGWRQHRLRGKAKAALEFTPVRIATNVGKIARYRAMELMAARTSRLAEREKATDPLAPGSGTEMKSAGESWPPYLCEPRSSRKTSAGYQTASILIYRTLDPHGLLKSG